MPEGIPTDVVLKLRQQGLTNNQIIQNLQRDGYALQQISDAMAQAEMKYTVEAMPVGGDTMQEAPNEYNYPETPAAGAYAAGQGVTAENIQALVETIIEEKWDELVKNVSRIAEWKDKTDQRLAAIEQQMSGLKESFDTLHAALLEKIGEYDKNIVDVGTELKALEKVFSKILPGFMENVAELSRITDTMKSKAPVKK